MVPLAFYFLFFGRFLHFLVSFWPTVYLKTGSRNICCLSQMILLQSSTRKSSTKQSLLKKSLYFWIKIFFKNRCLLLKYYSTQYIKKFCYISEMLQGSVNGRRQKIVLYVRVKMTYYLLLITCKTSSGVGMRITSWMHSSFSVEDEQNYWWSC